VRRAILAGEEGADPEQVIPEVRAELARLLEPRLATVINGTGVVIHTNLGRAPVSAETAQAMLDAATTYTPLELQIETGRRGGRMDEVTRLMRALTGAEATLVVNNNAGSDGRGDPADAGTHRR